MCWTLPRGILGIAKREGGKGQKTFTAAQTQMDAGGGEKPRSIARRDSWHRVQQLASTQNKSNPSARSPVLDVLTCTVSNWSALFVNGNPQGSTLPFSLRGVSLKINGFAAVWEGCRGGDHLIPLRHPLE